MLERMTDRLRKVLALANQEAQRFNHEYIGTEHILLGLVKEGGGIGANALKELGIDLRRVRIEVEKLVKQGPEMVTMGKLPQTPRAKKSIEYAIEEARNLNQTYVGTEHMLMGLIREQDGVAAQVLMNLGVNLDSLREAILVLLNPDSSTEPGAHACSRPEDQIKVRSVERLSAGQSLTGKVVSLFRLKPSGHSDIMHLEFYASRRDACIARWVDLRKRRVPIEEFAAVALPNGRYLVAVDSNLESVETMKIDPDAVKSAADLILGWLDEGEADILREVFGRTIPEGPSAEEGGKESVAEKVPE